MDRLRRYVLLALVALAFTGCDALDEALPDDAQAAEAEAPEPLDFLAFDGRAVPANATDLTAPQNSFKIRGWNSESSWIKLVDLVEEGKEVKKGDVVARFEFPGKEALSMVKRRIREAQAAREKSKIDLEDELRKLLVDRDKLDLERERARIDTMKANAISRRQLALFQSRYEEAIFEADAVRKQIAALRARMNSESNFHAQQVARAEYDMELYESYEKRFSVLAPHDGVVRHAYHRRRRRKIQKGDGMPSGLHVLSIARDETLDVQFFVPEHRLDEISVGQRVHVLPVARDGEFAAKVRSIERFPQEVGFLREDDNLPNAREKAFIVVASFDEQPEDLGAGTELKVSL